jgi:hypothetical protein
MGAASNYFAVGEPFMRLKARLYYALLGLNQATGFAGGYDLWLEWILTYWMLNQ